jgi:hypothetical protein
MKKIFMFFLCGTLITIIQAQTNPVITSWLRNTTGIKGRHYVSGNSTPITDADSANVQTVLYSATWSYIRTKGVPAYISGPFLDGNPSLTTSQNAIFRFPVTPVQNTGTATATSGGNIGIFINGVALFDYRDGASWKNSTSSLAGGPYGGTGDGVWNRDAVVGEKGGFDCSKGHPAMGNYHHHQNPSAFNLDLNVISTVCNLYLADGLYALDSTKHSPLIGFAYDGFPIYGAYAYKNADGTGGIVRMKSSYSYRNITVRNTYDDGSSVTAGPNVSATYPLGYFREDYHYTPTTAATPDYLDAHNGRFCVTPEYPAGIYCYFATVDANWNSAYPYAVGPTFYGVKSGGKVTSITEPVTVYPGTPLPGTLLSFTGKFVDKAVQLSWSTATEVNNDHFDVERATGNLKFGKIGEVRAADNSSSSNQYSFADGNPGSGVNYYRLKQWDKDLKFTYSNVVTVSKIQDIGLKIFPNPSTDLVVLQIGDILKHDLQVTLANAAGQVVLRKTFYQGTTICFLETTTLHNGTYFLTVIDDTGLKTSSRLVINQ